MNRSRLLLAAIVLFAAGLVAWALVLTGGRIALRQSFMECTRPYDELCQRYVDQTRWWLALGAVGLVALVTGGFAFAAAHQGSETEPDRVGRA